MTVLQYPCQINCLYVIHRQSTWGASSHPYTSTVCPARQGNSQCTSDPSLQPRSIYPIILALLLSGFCSDLSTRSRFSFTHLFIRDAQHPGGNGWIDYDRVFCQQAALDPVEDWACTVHCWGHYQPCTPVRYPKDRYRHSFSLDVAIIISLFKHRIISCIWDWCLHGRSVSHHQGAALQLLVRACI